jgi:hypothetical protein
MFNINYCETCISQSSLGPNCLFRIDRCQKNGKTNNLKVFGSKNNHNDFLIWLNVEDYLSCTVKSNRTLNKPQTWINRTLNKPQTWINRTLNKLQPWINQTINKVPMTAMYSHNIDHSIHQLCIHWYSEYGNKINTVML